MRDIYETKNSIYCYKGTNILINKLGIKDLPTLLEYESKITAVKLLALRKQGITGNFDEEHLKSIHRYLFEDIYPFAGKLRNENIAKGQFMFAQCEFIEPELQKLLKQLQAEKEMNRDRKKLASRLAYYMAELNVLHPFREGNGRTIREFIRQVALKNGYFFNIKNVEPQNMLEASIASIVDTKFLEQLIFQCLDKKPIPEGKEKNTKS